MLPMIESSRLAEELRRTISGEVRFDSGSRALYSTDASNYRQVPIGVVIPRSTEDIIETVNHCRTYEVPILMRGAGTSLAGQACNIAVVLDTSKYLNRVLYLDAERKIAHVEPGVVCDALNRAAASEALTFGPDPSTRNRCTLGGMIGNNSCGAHSLSQGKTAENVESLEVLTADGVRMWVAETSEEELSAIIATGGKRGEIYSRLKSLRDQYADLIRGGFPGIKRRVSGYNLDQLLPESGFNVARSLVGSEGTCAITLSAKLKLVELPRARVLVVLAYHDIFTAGDRTPFILDQAPSAIEGLDHAMIADMRRKQYQLADLSLLPEGGAWLLVEFAGDDVEETVNRARLLIAGESASAVAIKLVTAPNEQQKIWSIREVGAAAANSVPGEPETYPGWEDAAVEPARIGAYLRDYRQLLDRYGYRSTLYGHFGDGCLHGRVTFDLKSPKGIKSFRAFLEEAAQLTAKFGGSLSGEHGDGQARGELLSRMFSPELMQAMREFKAIWDPRNQLNPGKLVDPRPLDADLRPALPIAQPETRFSFFRDQNNFAAAASRCVGVGKCRRAEGGTMCPSYKATGEEMHSTRGRARLLFEMLEADPLTGAWGNQPVKDALELCLSCKACKSECPTQVDMASYKAEFFSHYYEHHLRPRQAYSMGLIHRWAGIASRAPDLFNAVTQTPGLRNAVKMIGGIARQRSVPRFANQSFTRWFAKRPLRNEGKPKVMLWPDTFTNYFQPDIAVAAVEVLEAAGLEIKIPGRPMCCGRPLYDFGWLDRAKKMLEQILTELEPEIEAGVPIIVLEPACLSVFRDELLNFFPHDERAAKLDLESYSLAEFLAAKTDFEPRGLGGDALIHAHCHQKAEPGIDDEVSLLTGMGVKCSVLGSGCCGMAGAFGFDQNKYEVSIKIGEQVLLPAVRAAPAQTLIIADGYSCREQIAQCASREALHSAQVLRRFLPR
ncbi:MAG: FAD-binding and (Fe-S)-binding domain-containing protein [Burkholderiales bacterium]